MSLNSSKPPVSSEEAAPAQEPPRKPVRGDASPTHRFLMTIGLPTWVFLGFMLAQAIIYAVIAALQSAGVDFSGVNTAIFNAVGGAVIYGLAIFLVLGMPWFVKRRPTTKEELGLQRLPKWMDFVWAPVGMFVYLVLTTIVTAIAMQALTFVDYSQTQQTGFAEIASRPEYIVAFISLVLIAPFAEEVLFRGYLLGKLRKYAPMWLAVFLTSALFAVVHWQWNVGIDVFVLSIVLCALRIYTGSLWAPILVHMIKNGVAFYFLFINPTLL